MEIGFNFSSGAKTHVLTLPDNTTFWFGEQQMLVCPNGTMEATIGAEGLTEASLTLQLRPEDVTRLAEHQAAGITAAGDFEPNIFVEVGFRLEVDRCQDVCRQCKDIEEPMELLFLLDVTTPALLNLNWYKATMLKQVTERIDSAA